MRFVATTEFRFYHCFLWKRILISLCHIHVQWCKLFSEADRFIQSGTFSGPLGDLIPLAIANVIQILLLVLNPSFLTPFVMISPEGMVPASNVVYLAYNASGPGHYDALIISQRDQQERFTSETNSNLDALESQCTLSTAKVPVSTPRKPCRCGEKNK